MNNNVLEFFVKMKDLMSSGLAKIAQNSKKSFGVVDKEIDHTIAKMKELSNSFDQVDRKANGSGGIMSKIANGFKSLGIGTAIAGVIGGAAIGGFLKDSIGASIQHEKVKQTFGVLTGNKGIGDALSSQLNSMQQDTILGPEVFKNAQTMMAFGITAEKVIPNLKMLGDVSMGDAEKLQSLTLAFSQVSAGGKLTGQDLLQFINAGFNPLNTIAKETGTSMADLRKKMEDGKISFAMVEGAFKTATGQGGLFNNMLNKMGETTSGKIANLQGGFEALKVAIGDRMRPSVNSFISGLTSIVGKVKNWFEIPIEKKLSDQIITIKTLTAQLSSANITQERQIDLLNQLEQINPKIVEGIDKQNVSYGKLRENVERVTNALRDNIKLEVMKDKITPTIMKYEGAMKQRESTIFDTMKEVTKNFPSIANATGMTDEQKVSNALQQARFMEEGWYKSHEDKRGRTKTPYSGLITVLNGQLHNINNLSKKINELEPEYNKGMADIANQKNMVDKVLGIGSMVTATGIKGGGGTTAAAAKDEKSVASGITSGGPRVINIHGVSMKIADTMTVNTTDSQDFLDQMEPAMQNFILRILNSGASVQS